MTAAVLALLASFSWGTADFLAGLESRRTTAWTAALVGQSVASLCLLALLAVTAPERPALIALAAPAVGGAIGGVGVVLQYRALSLVDMSVVSPIVGGAALVPVLWGVAGGERPGALQVAGIACTLVGIALISRKERTAPREAQLPRPQRRRPGAPFRRRVRPVPRLPRLRRAGRPPVHGGGGAHGGHADPVRRGRRHPAGRPAAEAGGPRPAAVGLLIAAANLLFATATTYGYLSIVGVLGWLNPAVTMVWAAVVLHERLTPLRLTAAALVFAGIVCITVG